MLKVKVVTKDHKPVSDAIVSLTSVPYQGVFPDIASITDEKGEAHIPCKQHEGKYAFLIVTEDQGRFTIEVELNSRDESSSILLVIGAEQQS
ncbi:hypothetical protein [Porphyromonas cangingivalis]|uniref:hypothetical protein n=1 Tax=Porphyromonas cangingivalis TaxID=36874 RepID=UPI00051CF091|nr:hypothetical protein [Porphyromonas cangingivalis]KGL48922.1 hypothetical protein HQ34_05465 [Porphyromonas cangingivalis]